jgi:hypothetical protein
MSPLALVRPHASCSPATPVLTAVGCPVRVMCIMLYRGSAACSGCRYALHGLVILPSLSSPPPPPHSAIEPVVH